MDQSGFMKHIMAARNDAEAARQAAEYVRGVTGRMRPAAGLPIWTTVSGLNSYIDELQTSADDGELHTLLRRIRLNASKTITVKTNRHGYSGLYFIKPGPTEPMPELDHDNCVNVGFYGGLLTTMAGADKESAYLMPTQTQNRLKMCIDSQKLTSTEDQSLDM